MRFFRNNTIGISKYDIIRVDAKTIMKSNCSSMQVVHIRGKISLYLIRMDIKFTLYIVTYSLSVEARMNDFAKMLKQPRVWGFIPFERRIRRSP